MPFGSDIQDRADAEFGVAHVIGHQNLVYVFSQQGYNKTTEAVETVRWADRAFTTASGDTPASTAFLPRLVVSNWTASLIGPLVQEGPHRGLPGLRNFAAPQFSPQVILNSDVDPDTGEGPLDEYVDRDLWSFAGRVGALEVGWVGAAYPADFVTVFETRCQGEPTWNAEGDLQFTPAPPMPRFGQAFQKRTYGGFGASLVFDGSTTYVDYGNEWNIGQQNTCLEWRLSMPNNSNQRVIQQKRATLTGGTDNGYSLYVTTGKQLTFGASDGTNSGTISMGSAGDYVDDVKRMFSVNVDWDNDQIEAFVSHLVSGVETTASLGTIDITGWGPITNTLDNIGGAGASGASPSFDGELDEFRVWRKVRAAGHIKAQAFSTCTGGENSLDACFKFDDRTSATTGWQNVIVPALVSLEYTGATHEISYGNVLNQGAGDSFTMGIWVKIDGTASSVDYIMGNRSAHAAGNAGYSLLCNGTGSDEFIAYMDDGTTRKAASSSGSGYANGVWHFVFLRADRSAETLECGVLEHRDAAPVAGTSTDTTGLGSLSNTNALTVARLSGGGNPMTGRTGHHFFDTQALTNLEIASLVRYMWDLDTITMPGNGLSVESTASSFWNQDEGSLTTITDSWGSRNGTVTAASWTTQDATLNGTVSFASSLDGDAGLGERGDESAVQSLRVPHVWGRAIGAECVLIDNVDDGMATATPIYQFADPVQGATKAFERAYSGGLLLTGGGSDYDTPDLTDNYLQLTAPQDETITADLKGYVDGSGDLIETVADIGQEIFTVLGETSFNSASFTQLNTDYPYQVGLVTDTDSHLSEEVVESHFRPSCWATKNLDQEIVVGAYKDLDGATADFALTTANIKHNGVELLAQIPPASNVHLKFRRNWTPLTSFLGGVQTPEQIRQSQQYLGKDAPVPDIQTAHEDADPIIVTSHIHRGQDATIEAYRLADILGRPLMILRVHLARDLFRAEIGDTVSLTYPRFGFSAGKNFMCIGYSYPKNPTLDLWGPFETA